MQDPMHQYASPYLGMGNNPINGIDPTGEIWWLCTEVGYNIQKKAVSPVAIHIDLDFGTHENGIGMDVSFGMPQLMPISYRFDVGGNTKQEENIDAIFKFQDYYPKPDSTNIFIK